MLVAARAIVTGRSYGDAIEVEFALPYPDDLRARAAGADLPSVRDGVKESAELEDRLLAERHSMCVAELLMREVVGDAGWDVVPEEAKEILNRQRPALIAELRGAIRRFQNRLRPAHSLP